MIEDKLGTSLINSGYRRMDSNVGGIYLFYNIDENGIRIVSCINTLSGMELTEEQYGHILKKVKDTFADPTKHISLLNIFFTREPDRVKRLCTEAAEDSHWIIDCSMNRLIIYETQTDDFYGLRPLIEQLLAEEAFPEVSQEQYGGGQARRGRPQSLQFTPVNIIIILINFIVFIISHFTPLLGGYNKAVEAGGLSWYLVRESGEYYRIISSMFLHSDTSHLVNNMLLLLFVGGILEKVAGRVKYLIIYFGAGILAAISSMGYNMLREYGRAPYDRLVVSIGASGAIFGVVGAILAIIIVSRGRLEYVGFRQIALFVILSLYNGFANSQIDQAAHIGGFLAGLILTVILYRTKQENVDV